MDKATKRLMDIILKKFEGSEFIRGGRNPYWKSPEGKLYLATSVFLRRTASLPTPTKKEEVLIDRSERTEQERTTKVTTISKEVGAKSVGVEEGAKKKKDNKKKTIVEVANGTQQREEEIKS